MKFLALIAILLVAGFILAVLHALLSPLHPLRTSFQAIFHLKFFHATSFWFIVGLFALLTLIYR